MNKNFPKILVYMQEDRLAFKGGPFAVGYCYYHEMKRRGENSLTFLPPSLNVKKKNDEVNNKTEENKSVLSLLIHNIHIYLWLLFKYFKASPIHHKFDGFDIVHFHSTQELHRERKNLKRYNGKVILQSHSPMPLGEELYDLIDFKYKKFVPFFKKKLREMDRYAFNRADFILFPCEDAEEPYLNRWEEYKEIRRRKKNSYRYVLTGIPAVEASRTKVQVIEELKLKDDSFIVSYAGRHNEAKGYDILKRIAEVFLKRHEKAVFVVAGKESPLTRLNHKRWIELGWTDDVKSYIAASDVFILPNRETYFDLVMIEVLSLGKIIVASRTGGNKYFEKNHCEGVFLYDSEEECISILHKISQMSKEERISYGQKNKDFYAKKLTVECMYDNYIDMILSIV